MIIQKKHLLNTLNRKLLTGVFVFCLAAVAGTIGCSDSGGGGSKTGYQLIGYDGVAGGASAQQSLSSAMGNENLTFYSEFPWFVNLTYQVLDKDDWGVADLTVNDFTVLEDGAEVSKLTSEMNIRKRDALPSAYSYGIKTLLFLDNTPSSSVSLERMLECGNVIVDNIDEKQQQQIAIAAYDEAGEAQVFQNFTDELTDLNKALSPTQGIQQSYGTTNLYSGVIKFLGLWDDNHSPAKLAFQQGFLVVVTDGKDTTSLSSVDDVIAIRGDKQVIVVAVGDDIPDNILNDLERLGNGGFYHVTDPLIEPDPKFDKKENLCENMLEVQKRMMAYADSFYWLRYKTPVTSNGQNSNHAVKLSIVKNSNGDSDGQVSGKFNSNVLFSGETSIYFNTSAADPDGVTTKNITIERGQGAGEVAQTLIALTYKQSGASPSQYEWTSGNTSVVTVKADSKDSSRATITVMGPGVASLAVKDTVNNVTRNLTINVKIREESFEMIRHVVTSQAPWFADATFQVRKTPTTNNRWQWVPDLAREDMTVMENGFKVDMEDSETHLRKRDNMPSTYSYDLKTVLLIDNSPSVRGENNLNLIKQAAKAFVKRAWINDPQDRSDLGPLLDSNKGTYQQKIAVVSFDEDGDTIVVQDFTSNIGFINEAIDEISRGFGPIDFYGAMIESLNLWDNDHSPYDAGNDFVQGAVVVLSDGWQSNPGFFDRQAVMDETGSKQIVCVGVGDDLVSEGNKSDLIDFGNAGFYSVPDPGNTTKVKLYSDADYNKTKEVYYTDLEKVLIGIQENLYAYANSFYWLHYKSALAPAPTCNRAETITVHINNNKSAGQNVTGKFESCNFFEGIDGMIYVNSSVTNPEGLTEDIDLEYAMMGNIDILKTDNYYYYLEAFTYNHVNTPAYKWVVSNENIVRVVVDPKSYANSRAALTLPAIKRDGSAILNITDTGNGGVFRRFMVNVSGVEFPMPLAYYPFNGNAKDVTGHGYDGVVYGAELTTDRKGKANSAYSFNANTNGSIFYIPTAQYIAIKNLHYGSDSTAVASKINKLTVCAWFKTTSTSEKMWIIDFDPDEYWDFGMFAGKLGGLSRRSSNTYNDGQWHFGCGVYDGSQSKLYVDGVLVSAANQEPFGPGVTRYGFIGAGTEADKFNGARNPDKDLFVGSIDEVMVFHDVLTGHEIKLLYDLMK